MTTEVAHVGRSVNVAFLFYCMILMGWPAVEYLNGVVFGVALTGCLDRPPIFRAALPQSEARSREQLLADSCAFIDRLEATMGSSRDSAKDEALLAHAEKDFGLVSSHPKPRWDLDT